MSAVLLANGQQVFLDANGKPLAGGTVAFYQVGTLTPKDTYTDQTGTTPNANPLTLDSAGRAVIFGIGAYRQILKDSLGNTIWDATVADAGSLISAAMQPVVGAVDLATARTQLGLGSAALLNAGTGANNVVQLDGSSKLPAVDGSNLTGITGVQAINAQTGAAYTYVTGDKGKLVTRTNAAAMGDTLPAATGSFASPFSLDVTCLASSTGALTITPASGTIDGQSKLVLQPGQSVALLSDSANWQIKRGQGLMAQVVGTVVTAMSTGSTVMPNSGTTVPTNTQGDQYLTQTITPTNINSTLIIDVVLCFSTGASNNETIGLFQDATVNALACIIQSTPGAGSPVVGVLRHRMTAGTTSATTFKVRAGNGGGNTTTLNGIAGASVLGGLNSSIQITEILP